MAFNPSGDLYAVHVETKYLVGGELKKISPTGLVTSFVGNTSLGYSDGISSGATFNALSSVVFDPLGNAFVADEKTVRKVTPDGNVVTIAGGSTRGYVNGLALAARFNGISGIAMDSSGNLFVSESPNNIIRKISTTGIVSTLAGPESNITIRTGYADGVGAAARFQYPNQIAIDASDNLYVADGSNHRIRKITPAGLVTTLAGQSSRGVVDGLGSSARFDVPVALTVDMATGDVYVADRDGFTIRRITPTGSVTTVVGVAHQAGVSLGSLPAGLETVRGLAIRGNRLYIASLNGIYWTNLPQ